MPSLPEFPQEGGCVCGSVRYRLKSAPLAVYNCHCHDCQKISGATHTISMICNSDTVELVSGSLETYDKPADSGRTVSMQFCGDCGTLIWNAIAAAPERKILKAGNLDDMSWARPVGDIWTSSKAPWVKIFGDEPQYEGQPESRQVLIDAWAKAHSN